MTSEQVSGGAEQSQPPQHCFLDKARGYGSLENAKWYPHSRVCNEDACNILGRNLSIQHGVGAATVRVVAEGDRHTAPGCPGGAFIMYDDTPPPLSIAQTWVEKREQQQPPGPQMPDQLPPAPTA